MVGFTESVIAELLHDHSKVRVSMVHMPALNTPQFNWVGRAAAPPAAGAADLPARGRRGGGRCTSPSTRAAAPGSALPTAYTILGNRVVAPLLDRYLARTGYDGQQSPQDTRPEIGDNLYAPVPGDQGAHGDFDYKAHERSPSWASLHRRIVTGVACRRCRRGALLARGRR